MYLVAILEHLSSLWDTKSHDGVEKGMGKWLLDSKKESEEAIQKKLEEAFGALMSG